MDQVDGPLFCSVYGQVMYCRYSGEFGIDFGEMQVWLCHERLRQFTRRVNSLLNANQPLHQHSFSWRVNLCPPSCEGEVFTFSVDELLDLHTLINGSLVMADLYQFLSNNQFMLDSSSTC